MYEKFIIVFRHTVFYQNQKRDSFMINTEKKDSEIGLRHGHHIIILRMLLLRLNSLNSLLWIQPHSLAPTFNSITAHCLAPTYIFTSQSLVTTHSFAAHGRLPTHSFAKPKYQAKNATDAPFYNNLTIVVPKYQFD